MLLLHRAHLLLSGVHIPDNSTSNNIRTAAIQVNTMVADTHLLKDPLRELPFLFGLELKPKTVIARQWSGLRPRLFGASYVPVAVWSE